MKRIAFDVLVVGGGPAGIAAAVRAAEFGARVGVVDAGVAAGGQIWRGGTTTHDPLGRNWFGRFHATSGISHLSQSQVIAPLAADELLVEGPDQVLAVRFTSLILATGARERFLPFPGWTLPGVVGVGGLQALAKGGLPVVGKRVVVAGSGPLLLAVASHLHATGARVVCIAEQAPWRKLVPFGMRLALSPGKAAQALGFARGLARVPFHAGCWPAEAHGDGRIEAVTLTTGDKQWHVPCDYLACSFGLVPNLELPLALGCKTQSGVVGVDQWQRTSLEGVFAAGEITGIGGVEMALIEGQIAGLAALGHYHSAQSLLATRDAARRFAAELEFTFALRPELARLPRPDTIVCRCEDVSYGAVAEHGSWRAAKLHTRCGMGACQGRICGGATGFLLGWNQDSIRPPLAAARVGTFAELDQA